MLHSISNQPLDQTNEPRVEVNSSQDVPEKVVGDSIISLLIVYFNKVCLLVSAFGMVLSKNDNQDIVKDISPKNESGLLLVN